MTGQRIHRNLFWGLINKLLGILLGILVPKIILLYMGSDTNGVLSTVNQVYGCITILEAGIGYATAQALYQPIALGDKKKINRILSATHIYYKRIGLVYLGIVLLLAYIFPLVGESEISTTEIRELVLLAGVPGAITFFLQGKFQILLEAEGRRYIKDNLDSLSLTVIHLMKIVLIVNGYGVVSVQLFGAFIQLSVMAYYFWLRKKEYDWLCFKEEPDYKAIAKKNNVLFHRISYFVFSNTDILLVSAFFNYSLASVYSIYSLLASTVYSLVGLISSGTTFYWGQRYNTGDMTFNRDYWVFQKIYYAAVCAGNSLLYILALPFVSLYTAGVRDINYLDKKLLILFIAVYTLQGLRVPIMVLSEIAGLFKETQGQAVLESVINLVSSIIFAQWMGIYGILLGTVVAIIYRDIVLVTYISQNVLSQNAREIYKRWIWNIILGMLSVTISRYLLQNIMNWMDLILAGIGATLIVALTFGIGNVGLIKDGMEVMKKR